jgi:hypothetical protein
VLGTGKADRVLQQRLKDPPTHFSLCKTPQET